MSGNSQRSVDAIVVGAGHNGLVAAWYLANAGLEVVLLERRDEVGGLCVTDEIFPGFRGNLVANSCHNLEPSIIARMDLLSHGLRFAHPEPSSFMAFPDGRAFVGRRSRDDLAAEIAKFHRHDAQGYFDALDGMSRLARLLDVSFFDAPPSLGELASRAQSPADKELFVKLMFGSATDYLDEHLLSPEVKATLGIVAVSGNFVGPSTPGSAYMLLHRPLYRESSAVREGNRFHTLGTGPAAPIGGMGAIAVAMKNAVLAAGVEVRTGAEVASIRCDGGRVTGVALTSGEEISARQVLSALNPKRTLADLVPTGNMPDEARSLVDGIPMRGSSFKVLLALDAAPRFAAASDDAENELFLRCGFRTGGGISDMDDAYYDAMRGRWSQHPVIWGLVPSAVDPTLTPPGKHMMSLSVFHAPYELADASWDDERANFGKHIVSVLADHYIPNLEQILLDYRCLSPVDLEEEFALTGGHVSHGDVVAARMFDTRPVAGCSAYTTPVDGLYLGNVGSWPANYVSGLPGRNAAARILRDLGHPQPV